MRKPFFLFLAVLAVAGLAVSAETPMGEGSPFEPPVKLMAGDAVIDVEIGHADPFVFDLNKDGKLDLLVGQFGGGKLLFFANTGTNDAPALAKGEFVSAGEVELSVPSG